MTFEAGGSTRELRFTANNLCRLEEATGRGVTEIAAGMANGMRISDLRMMLWAGIDGISLDQAGEIIDEIGFERIGDLIGEAFTAAFPSVDDNGGPGNGKGATA